MTAIGLMRHRLTIEMLNTAPLTAGGQVDDYITVATVWGSIEPMGTGKNKVLGEFYTHRIIIRWRDDMDAYNRLRKGSRVFEIRAVIDPDETKTTLVLMCDEVRVDVQRS